MFEENISEWLLIAQEAALAAGALFFKPDLELATIDSEVGRDIKTRADRESERIIINYLRERSGFSILSEESGVLEGKDKRFTWIVDPLDGSLNYIRGIPLCCISIALWEGESPLLGVLYDFNRSELFTGITGKGAWLNGTKIEVSSVSKKQSAVLCTGFPVSTDFSPEILMTFVQYVRQYKKVRLLGTAALSLAYVATGRAEVYMENDIKIWDVAAGIALVKAAGGIVEFRSTAQGNTYNVKATNHVLAACEVLKAL